MGMIYEIYSAIAESERMAFNATEEPEFHSCQFV